MNANSDFFEGTPVLNRRFALYLPSVEQSGEPAENFEILADASADLLCTLFGGVTAYPSTGRFKRKTGAFQKEVIVVLECFCDRLLWDENSRLIQNVMRLLARLLKQESIACSLDGEVCFVSPIAQFEGACPSTAVELKGAGTGLRCAPSFNLRPIPKN